MGVLSTIVTVVVVALGLNSVSEAGVFNAIVPNLSSGWFAKPGPTESLIFGLMVLKVSTHLFSVCGMFLERSPIDI
jgi:hypothetical protein